MKLTLDGVEALEAIAETGSFAAAAKRLHKVQSAVSYQVRHLEEVLGVALFDRSGHRATLTAPGQAMLDEGRLLLARARRMEVMAERFAAGAEPRLLVVVDGALPTGPLLEALAALGASTATHVQLRTEYLNGVVRKYDELRADIMVTLVAPEGAVLERVSLPPLGFVLVATPEHPVLREGDCDLSALQRHLELSVHDSDEQTGAKDTNLIPGARVFYVGDFASKKEGLLRGLGLGWMPVHAVSAELAAGRLVEVPFDQGSRRAFPVSLVSQADRPLGPAGVALRRELVARLTAALAGVEPRGV